MGQSIGQTKFDFETWRSSGHTLNYRDHDIFYQDLGSGPALLLLHGYPTASWDWVHLAGPLSARYRVIAPDFIGFGFSAKPADYDYSIVDQADLVASLLDRLGVDEVLVVAHDYGDTVTQEMIARHDERVAAGASGLILRGACLLNGGLFPETHYPLMLPKLLAGPFGRIAAAMVNRRTFATNLRTVFGNETQLTDEEIDEFYELVTCNGGKRVVHKLIRYMAERREKRERWVGALQNTRVPLKLVNGSADPVSGDHMVAHYRLTVPQDDITEMPEIGHWPQVEDPEGVLEALQPFLERYYPSLPGDPGT